MVDFTYHRESSQLSRGDIVITSTTTDDDANKAIPSPVHMQSNNRPMSPLTQNESMFGELTADGICMIPSTSKELICDYDSSVTQLYEMLESSDWEKSCRRCRTHPEEVHTWVSRRDTDGNVRWKLLPLHAAVIFQAPLSVIECLLHEHPIAAAKKDDQGMIPLHLAFRHSADEPVLEKLLRQYPGGVLILDQRGRLPLNHGKDIYFSSKLMGLYAETYQKCQHCEEEKTIKEGKIKEKYENRMNALKDAYEARISALVKTHEETVEITKLEAKQDADRNTVHHNQELDRLRSLVCRQESSSRRISELEAELNNVQKTLQQNVEDEKAKNAILMKEIYSMLTEQKSLNEQCNKQQEKLIQGQKLREQLLQTLLQKDDGKTIRGSNEICQLSGNILDRIEKVLQDNNHGMSDQKKILQETLDASLADKNGANKAEAAAWSADANDTHGDDISAITDSSYLQPFGDM